MNLIKTIRSSVKVAHTATQSVAKQVTAEVAQQAPKARDAFVAAVRPKVELHADQTRGLEGSAHVGPVKLASFTVGPAGIRASDGTSTVDLAGRKGLGGSTHIAGRELGLHLGREGAATLGSVDLEVAGHEFVIGIVPTAPSPLPMPIYMGPDRDGEG